MIHAFCASDISRSGKGELSEAHLTETVSRRSHFNVKKNFLVSFTS